ncbi:protein FAM43A isoform X2 [Bacillus rossius redtenbacheri]
MSSSKPDVQMKVTVLQAGLKAVTKEHGLTEYWSHRVTYCAAPSSFPRVFCWVYRHEGRKLKQELRCHAVLCPKESVARDMVAQLTARLAQALSEFKRDKVSRQNARLSLANSVYDNPSMPRRKILLSTGSHNYRPPLERSKSAPKLMVIEEEGEAEELELQEERRRSEKTPSPRRGHREEEPAHQEDDKQQQQEEEEEVSLEEEILAILQRRQQQQQQQQRPAKRVAWDDRLSECGPDGDEGTGLPPDDGVGDDGEEQAAPEPVGVDLRPAAGAFLGRKLARSATFPPPRAAGRPDSLELDSLSEEDEDEDEDEEAAPEEDNVSDESGFAELPEARDGPGEEPKHQVLLVASPPLPRCVRI